MSDFAGIESLLHWILREGTDLLATLMHWCFLLTDTQRMLLPTSVIVVTLLWSKRCPSSSTLRAALEQDEAEYSAAMQRWCSLGSSSPSHGAS